MFEFIKSECKIFNKLLDIGCGDARYLFKFNSIGFDDIIGVDNKPGINPIGNYCDYLKETLNIPSHKALEILYSKNNWFTFYNYDFNLYFKKYPQQKYSLIICRNVLHFYSENEKYSIIEELYNKLEDEGLLYIELNKNTHPRDTDPKLSKRIEGNTYEGFTDGIKTLRYLADELIFNAEVKKFNLIESLYFSDESVIKTGFRKHS